MTIKTVRLTAQESLISAYTTDANTCDTLLGAATKAELEEQQRRLAIMSGLDLGRLWIGDVLRKTPASAVKDLVALDQAISTFVTGLRGYFGGELGQSNAEAGPASSLAFTTTPDLTTPEGTRAEISANREIGERWNAASRRRAGQEQLPTVMRDEGSQKPWNGSGEPQEAGITIGDRRRRIADGALGDLIRNRAFGEDWNRRLRKMHGQPELY